MQIKTTVRFRLPPLGWAAIKRQDTKDMKKLELLCISVGTHSGVVALANSFTVPRKVKHDYHMIQQFHSQYIPKIPENLAYKQ